jgi:hypothetical protein
MFSDVEERQGAAVAVVNEALAARLWPGEDPLGRTIRFDGRECELFTVIGVSRGILAWTISHRPVPTAYLPYARAATGEPRLLLKTTGEEPGRMAGPARAAVFSVAPQWSVSGVATMTDVHYSVLSRNRTLAWLFAVLGVVAVLLAASGIYALMSHLVTQRTHEIGVRTALGAGPWRLVGGFLREGVTVVALGAAVGATGSWVLARLVLSGLYGLTTADPISILGASGIMVVAGVLATFLPARRAASVDPVVAMRG